MAKISDIWNPNSALNKVARLSMIQNEIDIDPVEIAELMQSEAEAKYAPIRAAESLDALLGEVSVLSGGLEREREERKQADNESMEYTKEINKKNLFWVRVAGIAAVLALLAALVSLFISITGFKFNFSPNPVAQIESGNEAAQHDSENGQPDGE